MHSSYFVRDFHYAFGHPVRPVPTVPTAKERLLRFRLIFEEVLEFGRAIGVVGLCETEQEVFEADVRAALDTFEISDEYPVSLPDAADALGDIDYVVQGSNLVFGFPALRVTREIHAANMSKLGADGRPIYDAVGKVVKGPNTRKPDIAKVLEMFLQDTRREENRLWGPR